MLPFPLVVRRNISILLLVLYIVIGGYRFYEFSAFKHPARVETIKKNVFEVI